MLVFVFSIGDQKQFCGSFYFSFQLQSLYSLITNLIFANLKNSSRSVICYFTPLSPRKNSAFSPSDPYHPTPPQSHVHKEGFVFVVFFFCLYICRKISIKSLYSCKPSDGYRVGHCKICLLYAVLLVKLEICFFKEKSGFSPHLLLFVCFHFLVFFRCLFVFV